MVTVPNNRKTKAKTKTRGTNPKTRTWTTDETVRAACRRRRQPLPGDGPAGLLPHTPAVAQQEHRVLGRGARRVRPRGPAASTCRDARRAVDAHVRQLPARDDQHRKARLPTHAAGPQRGPVLRARRETPRGDAADHLHADRGRGGATVQSPVPLPAWRGDQL